MVNIPKPPESGASEPPSDPGGHLDNSPTTSLAEPFALYIGGVALAEGPNNVASLMGRRTRGGISPPRSPSSSKLQNSADVVSLQSYKNTRPKPL